MNNTIFYKIIRPILKVLFKVLFRPKIKGINNLPIDTNYVLAGNHTKWLDPIMLIAIIPKQVHFLAKDSLFKGITKPFLKGVGAIPVNRKIHDHQALESAIKALNEKDIIGIFPEGTINREKKTPTLPFKIGAVKMANVTNTTIVPFVITGKYKLFSSKITIEFLKPRKISDNLEKENQMLREEIDKKLEDYYECNQYNKTKDD